MRLPKFTIKLEGEESVIDWLDFEAEKVRVEEFKALVGNCNCTAGSLHYTKH